MKLDIQFQIISKHHLNSNEKNKLINCPIYTTFQKFGVGKIL